MDRYDGCMVPARVTLAKDIVSSISVAQGKVAIGAGTAIGVGGLP
jgi:hypothetical protein